MFRDFRFGLAISNGFADEPVKAALAAEASGFDVAVVGDHIGPELAPMPTLAANASATTSIRQNRSASPLSAIRACWA